MTQDAGDQFAREDTTDTARPNHPWNDPDGDGHNCVDCPSSSIWKCDEDAHGRS